MKALTLTQPWATLVATGAKRIETRSWRHNWYRGPIAIHAGKGLADMSKLEFVQLCNREPFASALGKSLYGGLWEPGEYVDPTALPRGEIVAVARLADVIPTEDAILKLVVDERERAFGNYERGRYAWVLSDVQQLAHPIPASGALGLWDWRPPEDLVRALGLNERSR